MFWRKNKKNRKIPSLSCANYLRSYIAVDEKPPTEIHEVKQHITAIFSNSFDFAKRTFRMRDGCGVFLCFISGISSENDLEEQVIKPLLKQDIRSGDVINQPGTYISVSKFSKPQNWQHLIDAILDGNILLHIDGAEPVILQLADKQERSIMDPTTEYQVYGPKIGFIETSKTNIGILRQFIKDPRLKTLNYQIGTLTKTQVALAYLEEYCQPGMVKYIDNKLTAYNKDSLLTQGELTKLISKDPYSIFPQATLTERPELAAFSLIQGKIVLFVDNTTFCIVAPVTFMDMLETSEDQIFLVPWHLTFLRVMRLVSLFVGTTLPALYVALVAYQPELIPTTLTITVAQSRVQIPLPAAAEAFLMMFALDVLVEASIRLPSFVGQTIGIVGGLVIGQAAVDAGIVSNTMVIVIAFTAIATFTLPSWEFVNSWRIVRYALVISSSLIGLYGLVLAVGFLLVHLCKLESMDRPYMYPIAPFDMKTLLTFFYPKR
ncbi:spore germination protein KA/spore germination protein [Evansella caseinilytica]|uniref:Spore germination protein KA/spore germination protein n=1 Tax=Evansella caseinilytica TaxID=1503961 RepID=A0A1H3U7M2_9BACI|nr:spore germination protein [Evansella caseinilytica]SDZ58287.1 spore germination protein KA/spore germination protein [Evansella caseinilytica]